MGLKYFLFFQLLMNISSQYINDYCNINDSKTVYLIIKDTIEHFNLKEKINSTGNCMITNPNISNYYERFAILELSNKSSYGLLKCPECKKKFKVKPFLDLHYKLFHASKLKEYKHDYYCPGDFCNYFDCNRYKNYFSIPKSDQVRDATLNNQPIEKAQKCNISLLGFYKQMCMKMVEGCFDEESDYVLFYKNVCDQIKCIRSDTFISEGSLFDAMRLVFIYILSIGILIYLIIIWISKSD